MAVTAEQMKTQKADASQLQSAYAQRQSESKNNINTTMDSSLNTQKQGLQDAFNKNTTAQTEAQTLGNQAYETAKADLGVQADRTQRGMDSFADVRGLNRQEGSQQALQLGRARATATGGISVAQNRAADEMARRQAMLQTDYQNQVRQAIADNDYRRAAALLDDYNNQNNWMEKQAQLLAGFGNFSGYAGLYGDDMANNMQKIWTAQNPDVAYNNGMISAAEYERMTGQKPPDYVAPASSGGNSGYGGGYNGNSKKGNDPRAERPYDPDSSAYWSAFKDRINNATVPSPLVLTDNMGNKVVSRASGGGGINLNAMK